jgi:hypothetical protein
MVHVLGLGVNPNFINPWGESLAVLACKGGHIDVLKVIQFPS